MLLFALILVVAGLGVLYVGGEVLVRGSVALAGQLGLPKVIIGLVIVGFGTSMPEMLVSVQAALGGDPAIALGNVVGSNVANILLVVGAAAMITPVLLRADSETRFAAVIGTAVAVLLLLLCFTGNYLARPEGAVLLGALFAYLMVGYMLVPREARATIKNQPASNNDAISRAITRHRWLPPIMAVIGIGLLVIGAELLIEGAVDIARIFGVSDVIIGLTLVAFGTTLPELVAAVVAAMRREPEVIVGSVIGSNIFNILAILGVAVSLVPMGVDARIITTDIPLVIATSALMLGLILFLKNIPRIAGAVMLALYCVYVLMVAGQAV